MIENTYIRLSPEDRGEALKQAITLWKSKIEAAKKMDDSILVEEDGVIRLSDMMLVWSDLFINTFSLTMEKLIEIAKEQLAKE